MWARRRTWALTNMGLPGQAAAGPAGGPAVRREPEVPPERAAGREAAVPQEAVVPREPEAEAERAGAPRRSVEYQEAEGARQSVERRALAAALSGGTGKRWHWWQSVEHRRPAAGLEALERVAWLTLGARWEPAAWDWRQCRERGVTGSGGSSANGGASNTVPVGTGGSPANGGTSGAGATGGHDERHRRDTGRAAAVAPAASPRPRQGVTRVGAARLVIVALRLRKRR